MKIFIISDIHGSLYYMKKAMECFKKEDADRLIVLGDLFYHGPRNPLPKDYNPAEVSKILNELSEILKSNFIAIKGNCDSEVDQMISTFKIKGQSRVRMNNKKYLLTHGHKLSLEDIKSNFKNSADNKNKKMSETVNCDVILYGHFHVGDITKKQGMYLVNPGSISLPKNNSKNSYVLISDENDIFLKDLDGNVIKKSKVD